MSEENPLYIEENIDDIDWSVLTVDGVVVTDVVVDGSHYSILTKEFIDALCSHLNALHSLTLVNVTVIASYALSNLAFSNVEMILPETITTFEDHAFAGCTAINEIIIPHSVETIGEYCFWGCTSLNVIYFYKENSSITTIPSYFCSGGGLNLVGVLDEDGNPLYDNPSARVTVFPDSVTTISAYAFSDGSSNSCSSLGYTFISNNVTTIGDYAFYGCNFNYITFSTQLSTEGETSDAEYNDTSGDEDTDTDTDRTITAPYEIYMCSKRQFRYKHILVSADYAAGYEIPLDEEFKYCTKENHFMVFHNSLLVPPNSVYLHSIVDTPVEDLSLFIDIPLSQNDTLDIFYQTNDLKHLESEYYATNSENYITNGDTVSNENGQDMSIMGGEIDSSTRTNYIRLTSPLYAISSRHSLFVFLNGKKIRLDDLEDISDTILSVKSDQDNAIRLEVLNHLDTQDIIEKMYINDGLEHNRVSTVNDNINYFENNTKTIKSIDLTALDTYTKQTLLDEILNGCTDEQLNKLFYEYETAEGPTSGYSYDDANDKNFISRDTILEKILAKYSTATSDTSWITKFK